MTITSTFRRKNAPRIAHLLRVGGKWPRDNTATKTSNELPSHHELPPRRPLRQHRKYEIFGLGQLPTLHTKRKLPMSALCMKRTLLWPTCNKRHQSFCGGALRAPQRRGCGVVLTSMFPILPTKCGKTSSSRAGRMIEQTSAAGSSERAFAGRLAARKKRQRQNRLPDLIFYDHHQSRIVVVRIVAALFSQLSDCALGMRKCRRYIRQICARRVILDPCPSAYRKEISRHSTFAHYVEDQPCYRDWMAVFSQARLTHRIAGCGAKPR